MLFVTTWTVARQAPLSKDFSRQEYWSGLPFSPPEDNSNRGISLSLSLAGWFYTASATWETHLPDERQLKICVLFQKEEGSKEYLIKA